MFFLVLLGAPFLVAVLLGTAAARGWARTIALLGVGLLIGLAFVLYAYYSAPVDFQHDRSGCECEQYLGRWWDPTFVFFLVAVGFIAWAVGAGAGALFNAMLRSTRKPSAGGGEP